MTCDLDRVDALADGRLDGPEAKEVMEHLAGCPQCRAYYEGALAADRVLADTGINPPADFAAGVMERIRPRRQVQWPRAAAGLAACLLLAAGALSGQRAPFGRMLAGSGVAAAIVLGVGRAIGEAMAIIMVSGNVSNMPSVFAPVRFLTTGIVSGMGYAQVGSLYHQALFSIGLVLFLFIMLINVLLNVLIKKKGDA